MSQGWGMVPVPGQTVPSPADVIPLWRSRGLEPDPYCGIFGRVHLHPMPPSLEPDARLPVGHLQPMRLDPPRDTGDELPGWLNELDVRGRPVVYVSLGTHAYFSRPEFFQIILDALATLEIEVIATIGEHNQTSALGPVPKHVHVEQWLPLDAVLRRCTMVVCHGGSGTVLAALGASLPLLLLPRGADQFDNAAACARAGAARVLAPEALTPDSIITEVQHVVARRSYAEAADRLRAEIEAMPAPAELVPLLERLVNGDILRTELGATALSDRR